ncbi:MAG: FKBP-type peptidyl-prolyl cis-trans isomerase [Bacteroidales bacterium]|jgi:FKBP-type peptidyl-prolyl cis-trans isomerase|nr:FKBP-type peptidyl-prolyl cis-trans isomerase [Bacteroidales bacterium]
MKLNLVKAFTLLIVVGITFSACSQKGVSSKDLKTIVDSASYCFGANMGMQMKAEGIELNTEVLAKALEATFNGDTNLIIKPEQMQEVMMKFQTKMQEQQKAKAAEKGKVNREKGEKFLNENKAKEGVKTTASGLQYKFLKEGNNVKPTEQDRVRIQYRLTLTDGKVVESTFERNQDPVIMGLYGIIPGMKEGLQLMGEGSKMLLWVPADLGYGDMDSPELPAGSTLCFEVELVEVVKDSVKNTKK